MIPTALKSPATYGASRAGQVSIHTRRFQRDEEQAAEAVSHDQLNHPARRIWLLSASAFLNTA